MGVYLPAVVYRCLEYLRTKRAFREEGIFRLSGSANVIKALRERFNVEGDVDLLGGDYYDVHAVASLLKLYLRELPTSILTQELHRGFQGCLGKSRAVCEGASAYASDLDKERKLAALNALVQRLPRVNRELLQTLSAFLIDITDNSHVNKMTIRNVCIVFVPSLNISNALIALFITEYDSIFGLPVDGADSPFSDVSGQDAPDGADARQYAFADAPAPAHREPSYQWPPSAFPKPASMSGPPPPQPPPPPPQQQQQQQQPPQAAPYDTALMAGMQPAYDAPHYGQPLAADGSHGFGSLNGARSRAPPATPSRSAARAACS